MKHFFSSIFRDWNTHEEKEKIAPRLYIGKEKEEGYWEIIHGKSGEILLRTTTKENAITLARQLSEMIPWNQFSSLDELKIHQFSLYRKYKTFRNQYHQPKVFNGMYLWTKDEYGYVTYRVHTSLGLERVRGKLIVEGLAVRSSEDGYAVDHIITGRMLIKTDKEKDAEIIVKEISTILPWHTKEAIEMLRQFPKLRDYFESIQLAVESGHPIPPMPEEVQLDLLGIIHPTFRERRAVYEEAMRELNRMIGMKEVKEQIHFMLEQLKVEHRFQQEGITTKKPTLHMIFSGPPGTGKTQVARIIGKILYAFGYLQKNITVEVNAKDLIAGWVGQTNYKTQHYIHQAMGGVLFIDEAYGLASDSLSGTRGNFADDAIEKLLTAAENYRQDFCIILAGYESDMKRMLRSNPGLESRFPEYNRFYFRDYTPKELAMITISMLEDRYRFTEEAKQEVERMIERKSKQGSIDGNARWARNFSEEIERQHRIWVAKHNPEDIRTIVVETIQAAAGMAPKRISAEGMEEIKQQALNKLNQLVGMKELKAKVQEIMQYLEVQQRKFQQGIVASKPTMHMIFSGPPGTGKTTVAKIIGEFLKGAGLLSNGHFLAVSRNELVDSRSHDSTEKTKQVLEKALGGVLFIDEAYSLCGDAAGQQVVDLLIQEMENKREDLVVILAGYTDEIERLMKMNPGFRSRIPFVFDFPYYSCEEMFDIILFHAKQKQLHFTDDAKMTLRYCLQHKFDQEGKIDGNGRWARNFVEKLEFKQSARISRQPDADLTEIVSEDVEKAFAEM